MPDPVSGPRSARSPYLAIAAEVRAAIASGRLAPGDAVPAVQELASWYGVSPGTAQRALARLGEEGLVTLRRGARTRVAAASAAVG
jgi:DNA-binding GntR family transcriptional regulator